ncbi:hypothetical protein CHCC20442_1349 [Bacillus licheniformis]|nr:hypothetical protein CHCC20442_1349 [Bacillus licheniformis]TWN01103.1 hypothetical protein CHCC14566_0324 [Bacillus licheniformis]
MNFIIFIAFLMPFQVIIYVEGFFHLKEMYVCLQCRTEK